MKKAIVIGASSGIGKAIAILLAKNNYSVGIAGRRKVLLEEVSGRQPGSYFIELIDVTNLDNLVQNLDALKNKLGGLDLLIFCSGIGDLNDQLDFDIEQQTIATNVSGFTCVADWAFNQFKNQQTGHLVAITSVGGLRGSRHAPAYNASKAYQINYLEGLRQKAVQLHSKIIITDVRPGFVDTAMAKGEGLFWVSSVEKAAQQIFCAIKRKRKIVYVTKRWKLIGSILKRIPRVVYDRF